MPALPHAPERYDVAIIGGGVVGCALAMELSQFDNSVALLEAGSDVGAGTSKASSAVLHTGFDAPPGSLEAQLVRRGYQRYREWSGRLGLPVGGTGALLIAWNEEQKSLLPAVLEKAALNGVSGLREIPAEEVYLLEPHLGAGVEGGLLVPGESITCPFTPVLAFAATAVVNGVRLRRNFALTAVERTADDYLLSASGQVVRARVVINAAGLWSDDVDRLLGKNRFTVRPRKGEFLVFDKPARRLINHILLPVPTARTKGVLAAPTVFGNLLVGPTAIDITDKRDLSVSAAGIRGLLETAYRILPKLREEEVTSTYAGLRAATEHQDYQIHFYPDESYVTVGGIRSTGLSAALGIAEFVTGRILADFGLSPRRREDWRPHKAPAITELAPRVCENAALIAQNPAYGTLLCHCEWVSRGEILDALRSPVPAADLDGIKRRTRATMGRCQGFHCYAALAGLLNVERTN